MRRTKKACPGLALTLALLAMGAAAFSAAAQEPAAQQYAAQQPALERSDVARFRQRVEAALTSNGAERGYWGALVVDAETGETLYALNADHYFKPASNVKLFTTTMALASM